MEELMVPQFVTVTDHNKNNELDQKMSAWFDSVTQGCSKETSLSLLASALDVFALQFPQGSSDVKNSPQENVARSESETERATALLVQELQRDTEKKKRRKEWFEYEEQPCSIEPQPRTVDLELALQTASVAQTDDQPLRSFAYGVSQDRCIRELHSWSSDLQIPSGCRGPGLNYTATWNTALVDVPTKAREEHETAERQKRKRKHGNSHRHRHERHSSAKRAKQESNKNNYSSLDARLEHFYVCPKTNRLIPKGSKTVYPDSVRHAGFKKEKSLLVKATTRCLALKAMETGTCCCYNRCFKRKKTLYY